MKTTPRREALSRDRILTTAVRLLDRAGADALSMRGIADELGVEAMSLYNHVANKADVLDGIFERLLAELPAAPRPRSWRGALRERARALRGVLRAHPHALTIFATRPAATPAAIAHLEAALAVLAQAGFSTRRALATVEVLVAFVVGHTVACYAPVRASDAARPAYDDLDEESFPHVRAAARTLAARDPEAEFEFGLEAMLAGIGASAKRD